MNRKSAEGLFPTVSARDLAYVMLRRKWSIFFILSLTMMGAVIWLWGIRDELYESTAKVLVKIGREQAPPPTVMGASPMVIGYRSQEVNSEIDILQSTELVTRVVDRLRLDQPVVEPAPTTFAARMKHALKDTAKRLREWQDETMISLGLRERLTPREKMIDALYKGLTVKPQKDSNVFVAQLRLPKRRAPAPILNAVLDDYLESRLRTYQGGDLQFFRAEVNKASADLRRAEEELQGFENASEISTIEKQQAVLLDHIAQARAGWVDAEALRQENAARVKRLESELQKEDPDFSGVSAFGREGFEQDLANQLADLQQQREKLRLTELDSGDRILNNRAQFKVVSGMLAANLRTALAEKAEQARLRRVAYDEMRNQLSQLHGRQSAWSERTRKVRDLENTYLAFRKKLDEASANNMMEQQRLGNVTVIERATDPLAPVGLRKTTIMVFCVLVGLLIAATWVTIAEFFDHRIYTVEDLEEHVPGPVFAAVPADKRFRITSIIRMDS